MYLGKEFQEIYKKASEDPRILGLVVGGSRGKGFNTENSDYDFQIITKAGTKEEVDSELMKFKNIFDMGIMTLDEFKNYASWGSKFMWDRYNFTHVQATIDKTTGKIQEMIDEKGKIPEKEKKEFVCENLDHYINQVYRSIKCLRDNFLIGFHLEASESIRPLLNCLFAIHANRIVPYYKYIKWELTEHPLTKIPWSSDNFLEKILKILETGDLKTQQLILKEMEIIFRIEGFGEIFDSWDGEDKWTMEYIPNIKDEKPL